MAAIIPAVMVAGAAISAIGAVQSAKATQTAALYNAQQNEANAAVAQNQAQADIARFRNQYLRHQGSMIATTGASGVTEEGSPLAVLADSATNARLDEETMLYKSKLRSIGYYNSASLDRLSAETALEQGRYKSASAFLSGIGHAGAVTVAGRSRTLNPTGSEF